MENSKELAKARELLEGFQTGMLVTRDAEGGVHARPMMIAEVDQNARISFITRLGGQKVNEALRTPQVGVTLQKVGAFVAVAGLAEVIVDREQKQRVWNKLGELWFEGPDDPQAGLISVVPRTIEYWDNRGLNALKFAFQALVAKAQGEDPEADATQHGSVRLTSEGAPRHV